MVASSAFLIFYAFGLHAVCKLCENRMQKGNSHASSWFLLVPTGPGEETKTPNKMQQGFTP